MIAFGLHEGLDWCHMCGERKKKMLDIWYPFNAEHDDKPERYLRACETCLEFALMRFRAALKGEQP